MASGLSCHDKQGNSTLQRWHEIINPDKEEPTEKITKESVKSQFEMLRRKKSS